MRFVGVLLCAAWLVSSASAHTNYTGYSGAPGSHGTCAQGCHGSGTGTVSVFGFPTSYLPDQEYLITIRKLSGSTISNFNASCRVGTGSAIAGSLAAGTSTSTYSVSSYETSGVHFTSANHDSGTFTWTAPAAGTGDVRLYVAAHQGAYSGANTVLTLTAQEAASAPGQAASPDPADGAANILPDVVLQWEAGARAAMHDVYFGTDSAVAFIRQQTGTQFDPPDSVFHAGMTYYWRIDERGVQGITYGPLWHFTMLQAVEVATNPEPSQGATNVPITTNLSWTAGANTSTQDLYLGLANPPQDIIWANLVHDPLYDPPVDLLPDTTYYWQVIERNPFGEAAGPVWSFRTEPPNATRENDPALLTEYALGPAYPNPFNATVTIPFVLPSSSAASLTLYDLSGRTISTLANGNFTAGLHQVSWSSSGVGSGIYFLQLNSRLGTRTLKILALK